MKGNKRIWYFMTPAFGHSLCALPIVKILVEKGYDVTCFSSSAFKTYIEKTGATFREYTVDFSTLKIDEATENLYILLQTLTSINRELFMDYEEVICTDSPDLIIYDSMCSFAKNLAVKYRIKSTCIVSTIGFNAWVCTFSSIGISTVPLLLKNAKEFKRVLATERAFRKSHGIQGLRLIDLFMNRADETIVLTPRELQPFANTFGKHVHFVGTTIKDQISILSEGVEYKDYDVFISMGTVFTDRVEELVDLFDREEFAEKKTMLISPKAIDKKLPAGVDVEHWVVQLDLLPHCKAVINQGGANSVYQAMYFGIPQISIPIQEEQRQMACMVRRLGCGVYLKKYDVEQVAQAMKKLPALSIKRAQDIVRSYDGTANAVEIIEGQLKI